jgi:hypothetical protein
LVFTHQFLGREVPGFELKASHLVGRHSTASATLPALSALVILEIGSCFLPRPAWISVLLFMLPIAVRMTNTRHCAQPLIEMGSC